MNLEAGGDRFTAHISPPWRVPVSVDLIETKTTESLNHRMQRQPPAQGYHSVLMTARLRVLHTGRRWYTYDVGMSACCDPMGLLETSNINSSFRYRAPNCRSIRGRPSQTSGTHYIQGFGLLDERASRRVRRAVPGETSSLASGSSQASRVATSLRRFDTYPARRVKVLFVSETMDHVVCEYILSRSRLRCDEVVPWLSVGQ